MIRLRTALERGRAHPVLGPLVLILLVLLLAMVLLHAAGDGHESATELGALCLAVISLLGMIVLDRPRQATRTTAVQACGVRGPPRLDRRGRRSRRVNPVLVFAAPLRR